ncbi:Major facilitator superfamily,Major facilitator superfamily domain [Cinara cedri]|uniref:Major facilitator superfamily,Major facilitator superfamily domain n=1 Tax=Cinara cedri TaxID=506608 RepID=A0A5E4N2Z4_9HEMI|nr:Major facilitator superfamily,Major facilitator superfamily domain [Cinara cedri]
MDQATSPLQNHKNGQMPFWKKRRNLVTLMVSLGYFNFYTLRVNLAVAIVAMTSSVDNTKTAEFDWDSKLRGIFLSAFSYGYITTQMVGGLLSTKFGGVKPMGYGVLLNACFTVLTPFAARFSVYLAIAFTVAGGMFQGISYPSTNAVWLRWIPPTERAQMSSFGISGSIVGIIVGYPVCGWLAKKYGWTYVFYVPGFVAALWSIIWLTHIAESPKEDVHISEEEREYIVSSIGSTTAVKTSFFSYPWKCIFTSMPIWAISCAHFCSNWGALTLLLQLPSYINDVFKFDIGQGGFLSSLPYIALTIVLQITGLLDYWIKRKNLLTTTQSRKLFSSLSALNRAIFMYLTAYSTTAVESIVYLILAMGLGGFYSAGFIVNHLDVAPQYSSLLMGISNTFGNVPGFVTPMVAGLLVQHKSAEEWKWVFIIASIVQLFGGIFYVIFATGERLHWAEIKPKDNEIQNPLFKNVQKKT